MKMFLSREGNMVALFVSACLIFATFFFAGPASAQNVAPTLGTTVNTCTPSVISASLANYSYPGAPMQLVVDTPSGAPQSVTIPGDGSLVSINVGPFLTDTTVSYRVFGGAERDFDDPKWTGYPGFAAPTIAGYNATTTNQNYDWVTTGTDDPNPFFGTGSEGGGRWYTVVVPGCSATLTLEKVVDGDPAPNVATDWTLDADGTTTPINGATGTAGVTNVVVEPGDYVLSETGPDENYTASEWVCTGGGSYEPTTDTITLAAGEDVTCVITNTYTTPQVDQYTVTIKKYVDDAVATAGTFPMTATWTADNLNGGAQASGNFDLNIGNGFTAVTSPMDAGANYTTEETFDGNDVGATCAEGKDYGFVGYSVGADETDAIDNAKSTTPPDFEDLQANQYVIVWNKTCPEPEPTATVRLCKKDPSGAPLAGWELFLKGNEIENLSVDSASATGTDTANTYANGVTYIATANGTWENRRTEGLNIVDAEYSTTDTWATQMDGFTGFGTEILELFIDGSGQTWGAYDSSHEYSTTFVGDGTTVNFTINDTSRVDNFGSLDVSIAAVYSGTTDDNGCVEFADVPYGTYEVDETDQAGWSNVSGLGEAEVDSETEEFVVVNEEVNNPPLTTITNPADNATVSGTVDIRGTLVEDVDMGNWNVAVCAAGDDCSVNANRILQNNVPHPAPLDNFADVTILTWDTTNGDFPDGNYIIRFAARDAAGNRDLTDPDEGGDDSVHIIEVTVDNEPTGTLVVQKIVVGGDGVASEDFSIHVKDGGNEVENSPKPGNAVGTQYVLATGNYVVSESDGPNDFVLTFSGACDENGNITVVEGEEVKCVLTNTYEPENFCDKDEIDDLKKEIKELTKEFKKDVRELKKNSSKWVKKGRWGGYWQYDHWNYYKKYIELLKEYKIELHILVDKLEEAQAACRGYDKYKWGKWHHKYGIPFDDEHDFEHRIEEWYR